MIANELRAMVAESENQEVEPTEAKVGVGSPNTVAACSNTDAMVFVWASALGSAGRTGFPKPPLPEVARGWPWDAER